MVDRSNNWLIKYLEAHKGFDFGTYNKVGMYVTRCHNLSVRLQDLINDSLKLQLVINIALSS